MKIKQKKKKRNEKKRLFGILSFCKIISLKIIIFLQKNRDRENIEHRRLGFQLSRSSMAREHLREGEDKDVERSKVNKTTIST